MLAVTLCATTTSARRKRHRAATAVAPSPGPETSAGPALPADPPADGPANASALFLPDAARIYQRSYDHEASGHYGEALRDLGALSAGEQESYLARLRRGWLLYLAARYPESIAAYRQAIAVARDSVEARVGSLLPLIALRQWTEVEQGARAALELDAANYLAGLRLAFAVYNRGRYPEAEALYRRVLARYPSDAVARSGLGWSLLKLGKRAEAREEFLEAARAAPRSPAVLDGLKVAAE